MAPSPKCFNCGAEATTRDHIPAKTFFIPPLPDDLITMPACEACNLGTKKDDEVARLWMSSSALASPQWQWIFKNKGLASLKRSPKLAQHLAKSVTKKSVLTDEGRVEVEVLGIPKSRVIPLVGKWAKGLVHLLYPDYSHLDAQYRVRHVLPTNTKAWEAVKLLMGWTTYLERGKGIFRLWHARTSDMPDRGCMVLMFYDGVIFLVEFGHSFEDDNANPS